MSIFKTISNTLANLVKGPKPVDGVDKMDILYLIDNNLILINSVINTFNDNPDIIKYIQTVLLAPNGTNKDNTEMRSLYTTYTTGLSYAARNAEKTQILQSFRDTAVILKADHENIRNNFVMLFNQGTDVSEIQLKQMKLSHAAIFGFINLSALMCDWFCFFYANLIGRPNEGVRAPAYREQLIKDSGKRVADFVNDVLGRGSKRGILDVIAGIKDKGDVTLYSDAASLDTYANINDYPGAMKLIDAFGNFIAGLLVVFQPIMWVRELFTKWAHDTYRRNILLRDWMITKTAVLRMDLAKIDPDSPEYQRQLNILNKYSDEIAILDKKIADYGNS